MSLLVTASTFPSWSGDPCPRFVLDLCRGLDATGKVRSLVLAPHSPGAPRRGRVEGIPVRRFRYAFPERLEQISGKGILHHLEASPWRWSLVPGFLLSQWWTLCKVSRRERPRAVLAHWLVPQGALAVLGSRAPVIVVVHGGDIGFMKKSPWRQKLGAWILSRADRIVAVSPYLAAELTRVFGTDPKKITVIPMGVDTARFRPRKAKRSSTPRFLFVGRLVPGKGLDVLLDAFALLLARHPGARLEIVGDGELRERLERRADRLGLAPALRFCGGEPHARLVRRIQKATALVVPSVEPEGLGLVIPEAFGAGVPVIATRAGGIASTIEHGHNGLLARPGDARALAREMQRIIESPALEESLVRQARATFDRNFTLSRVAGAFLRELESL